VVDNLQKNKNVEPDLVLGPPFADMWYGICPFRMKVQSRSVFQFNFMKIFLFAGRNVDGWKE
jgi:hypothetical protein